MDLAEARQLAEKYINEQLVPPNGMRYLVAEAAIKDAEDGWYFPYQTDAYLQSGDINQSVVGNWPIFVSKGGNVLGPRRPG